MFVLIFRLQCRFTPIQIGFQRQFGKPTQHKVNPQQPTNHQNLLTHFFTAWTQGQFIQQIPAAGQPALEGYTQQYPNGIYQTTYQQAPFDGNTFYTGAVQVLTNTRPPSAPSHSQLTPRANGSYSHTPSPVPSQQQPATQQGNPSQQRQYHQEYNTNTQNYIAPATTPTPGMDSHSRPSSVNSTVNTSTNNQNFAQQQNGATYTPVSSTNFSPGGNAAAPNYVISNVNNANSGNAQPGYPQVSSSPQLASLNSSGCPGNGQYSGNNDHLHQQHQQQHPWEEMTHQQPDNHMVWEQHHHHQAQSNEKHEYNQQEQQNYQQNDRPNSHPNDGGASENQQTESHFSQADRVNLNTRLKTMILNKQQNMENKEDGQKMEQNQTGHFLSYSHHHRLDSLGGGGGEKFPINKLANVLEKRKSSLENGCVSTQANVNVAKSHVVPIYKAKNPSYLPSTNYKNSSTNNYFTNEYFSTRETNGSPKKSDYSDADNLKQNVGSEIPPCECFPPGMLPQEPGSYYTHLGNTIRNLNLCNHFEQLYLIIGCSTNLVNLRKDFEERTGVAGGALRIEKVCYTGKEGKTAQGCPLAKWVSR